MNESQSIHSIPLPLIGAGPIPDQLEEYWGANTQWKNKNFGRDKK